MRDSRNCTSLLTWASIQPGETRSSDVLGITSVRGGVLPINSVFAFLFLMAVFIGMGYFVCRKIPPYNSLVPRLLNKKGYYQELESMRGILALAVVIHHSVTYYFLLYRGTPDITGSNANF